MNCEDVNRILDEMKEMRKRHEELAQKLEKLTEIRERQMIDEEDNIPSIAIGENIIKYHPRTRTYRIISKNEQTLGVKCGKKGVPFKEGINYGCNEEEVITKDKDKE